MNATLNITDLQTHYQNSKYVDGLHPDNGPTPCGRNLQEVLKSRSLVFDIGTGLGRDAIFLAQNGHDVVAIDAVERATRELGVLARKKALDHRVRTITGNVLNWYVPLLGSSTFDAAILSGILHMLSRSDAVKLISEVQNSLSPWWYCAIWTFTDHASDALNIDKVQHSRTLFSSDQMSTLFNGWESLFSPREYDKKITNGRIAKTLSVLYKKPLQ